jgi:hypothetical protein
MTSWTLLQKTLIRRFRRFAQIEEEEALAFEAWMAEVQQQASLQTRGFQVIANA